MKRPAQAEALIGGAHALAGTALEAFVRHVRLLHYGHFYSAQSSLDLAETRADQALTLDSMWRTAIRRKAS
jgi:hypothetical protein